MSVTELIQREQRAHAIGKWGNLVVGTAGVLAAWLSDSQALLVGGLYSLTGFFSAILNSRISTPATQNTDCHRVVDCAADTSMFWTVRSLALLGLVALAMFSAISNIINYAIGGAHSTLRYEPITVYVVAVCAVCAGLALIHRAAWLGSGRQSEILYREMRESIFDGMMAFSAGTGLLIIPLLRGGSLEWPLPIGDSVIVVLLCCLLVGRFYTPFMSGLAQLAEHNAVPEFITTAQRSTRPEFTETGRTLIDFSAVEVGRRFQASIYYDPGVEMSAMEMDMLTRRIDNALCAALERTGSAVIVSRHGHVFIGSIEPTTYGMDPE